MAATDRARDFVARFVTDLSRFRPEPAARALADTGDAAEDAGRSLDDLDRRADDAGRSLDDLDRRASGAGRGVRDAGDDAARAGRDLDELGDGTARTAARLDDSFDRIRAASRQGLRGVGDEAERAGDKLRDAGEEGIDTAREMGASFSGSADDVTDAFQEVAANALQSFGIVGTAAGVAAAIGIGVLRAGAERLRETVGNLTGELIDAGGRLERESVLSRLREFAEEGTLNDLAQQARTAGVDVNDFLVASAGDPAAIARTTAALAERRAELLEHARTRTAQTGAPEIRAQANAIGGLIGRLDEQAQAHELARQATRLYLDAQAETGGVVALSAEQVTAYTDALGGFVDPLAAYTDALTEKEAVERAAAQATADATADTADSWEDYAGRVDVALDEYLANLREQVTAQEEWHANMSALAGRVTDDTLAELAALGPEGAALIADLVDGTDAELSELDDLFRRRTAAGTAAMGEELDRARGTAADKGRRAGAAYADNLAGGERATQAAAARLAGVAAQELEREFRPVVKPRLDLDDFLRRMRSAGGTVYRV